MARALLRPAVEAHLLTAERERVVDQLPRHWVTRLPGVGAVVAGMVLLLTMPLVRQWWPACLAAGVLAGLAGFWLILRQELERFVVTNLRLLHLRGVVNQRVSAAELGRLPDVTVSRPLLGRLLGYGHLVLETDEGDAEFARVAFVPGVERHNLTLQTVLRRARGSG